MSEGNASSLRILIVGAHPDDPDIKAGGVAALYSALSHTVKIVSLTNGDAGHHEMGGAPLAWRRRREAEASGACLGVEYVTLDNHDGELAPSLDVRREVIELIREFGPDLIMSPRLWDYHPDHRATAQLVLDAIYLLTVPNVVSHVPHLRRMPVLVYLWDRFRRPYPFAPDVVVDIDSVVEQKLDALHCHESQVYEWLPYNGGTLDQVPEIEAERRAWLGERYKVRFTQMADLYRDRLVERYGQERGNRVRYVEAFEGSEHGARLTEENLGRLFAF